MEGKGRKGKKNSSGDDEASRHERMGNDTNTRERSRYMMLQATWLVDGWPGMRSVATVAMKFDKTFYTYMVFCDVDVTVVGCVVGVEGWAKRRLPLFRVFWFRGRLHGHQPPC